jgi:hypothetical protein
VILSKTKTRDAALHPLIFRNDHGVRDTIAAIGGDDGVIRGDGTVNKPPSASLAPARSAWDP